MLLTSAPLPLAELPTFMPVMADNRGLRLQQHLAAAATELSEQSAAHSVDADSLGTPMAASSRTSLELGPTTTDMPLVAAEVSKLAVCRDACLLATLPEAHPRSLESSQ